MTEICRSRKVFSYDSDRKRGVIMQRLFPPMYDRPDGKPAVLGGLYWFVFLILLPTAFQFAVATSSNVDAAIGWGSFILYAISFGTVILIFREYLVDSFLNVQIDKKRFAAVVAVASCALLVALGALECLAVLLGSDLLTEGLCYVLPFAELPMWIPGFWQLEQIPLWGTLCLVILVPVSLCCLYYAVFFSPFAVNRPWLGYLAVMLFALVPRIVGLGSAGLPMEQLVYYLVQMPWHLVACWAYQKADTIWAPISVYAIVNLCGCLRIFATFVMMGA